MANSASLHLFELITSMTRSEKRYFKIYVRTHSSKHVEDYVSLFSMVEAQEEYDEAELTRKMDKLGSKQRFAVMKHRLFEKVVDALESFQRTSNEEMGIRHELNRAQVLLNRGMTRAAESILRKAQKKAAAIEAHELILTAETLLLRAGVVLEEETHSASYLTEQIKEEHDLIHIRTNLFQSIQNQGRVRTEVGIDTSMVQERFAQTLEDKDSALRSQYLAHHGMSALLFARNEIDESLEEVKHCMSMLKEHEHIKKEFPLALIDLLANSCYINLRQHKVEQAYGHIQELLSLEVEDLSERERIRYSGALIQSLLFYLNREEDINMSNRLEIELRNYEKDRWEYSAGIRAGIDYGLGLLRHRQGRRGDGLRSLNRILNDGEIHRDTDVYHRTLVLTTVLHIESGDKEWMAHSARALKRYLNPRGLMNGVETILLDYVADHRRSRSEEGQERALRQFIIRLRSIRKDSLERQSFEYFDFLQWAEDQLGEEDHSSMVA